MTACPNCGYDLTRAPRKVRVYDRKDLAFRAAEYLFERIRENNPTAKEPNWQSWAREFDAIYRIDKRDMNDIKRLIDWCQHDSFWCANILSPKKLREKFDQLTMAAKRSGGSAPKRTVAPSRKDL